MERDLITAISTAPGTGAIGVVRVSGAGVPGLLSALLGRQPEPRRAVLVSFLDASGETIDQGIAIYFAAPHSFTGEHMLELQGHGGPAVLKRVLKRCVELGARLAEPGEFTKRAFLNGKLDLAQAEAVADLIEARSETAARSALRSLRGDFSREIEALVSKVTELRAFVEAAIDFPDEDIDPLEALGAAERLMGLLGRVNTIEKASRQGALLREGAQVVLVGRPNVGKSSLLNRLAGEELAIVTAVPGTTRDLIRQELLVDGVPIQILDTAGLRESADPIEQLGMRRTRDAMRRADVALVVADVREGLTAEDLRIVDEMPSGIERIIVLNKADLAFQRDVGRKAGEVLVSALTGEGMDVLRRELLRAVGWRIGEEGVFLARERHLLALADAKKHLLQAQARYGELELFAEELRLAQLALGRVTGELTADDLLGEIFQRFCLGK